MIALQLFWTHRIPAQGNFENFQRFSIVHQDQGPVFLFHHHAIGLGKSW